MNSRRHKKELLDFFAQTLDAGEAAERPSIIFSSVHFQLLPETCEGSCAAVRALGAACRCVYRPPLRIN